MSAATTSACPADDARCKALRPFCNEFNAKLQFG